MGRCTKSLQQEIPGLEQQEAAHLSCSGAQRGQGRTQALGAGAVADSVRGGSGRDPIPELQGAAWGLFPFSFDPRCEARQLAQCAGSTCEYPRGTRALELQAAA